MATLPVTMEVVLLAVALAAAVTDFASRRIPNWITLPGAALGLAMHAYYGGWHGAVQSFAGAAMGFGFFLLLHLAGGMGAGDVKLAGAVGALVGPQAFVVVFIATGLLGGVAALILMISKGRFTEKVTQTARLLLSFGRLRWSEVKTRSSLSAPGALRLPYGAVIAGGALTFLAFYH